MERNARRERIQGAPRQGALLTVSAALLMAGPVVDWLLSKVVEDYYSSIPLFFCLLAVAGGVLLLTSRGRRANDVVGGALALFGAAVLTNEVLLLVSVAVWVVSALGTSWNKVPAFLPEKLRMPVLDLVAAVVFLLTILLGLRYHWAILYLLPRVLSLVGGLLLCVNVEPQTYLPQSAQTRVPGEKGVRYRSVPKAGALAILGALFLVGDGVDQLVQMFQRMGSFEVSPLELLWPLLVVAAGVMLLLRTNREKWALAAAALLLISQFRTLLTLRRVSLYSDSGAAMGLTQMAALLFAAELLMLLGAVGFTWNRPVGKRRPVPLLNVIAAVLAAVNGIWTLIGQIQTIIQLMSSGTYRLNFNLTLNLILYVLLPLGLVLVNLTMEGHQAPPKAWKVDGEKYSRGLRGFVGSFYTGVGGKLQLLAKISGVLCLILGLLGVVMMLLSILLLLLQLFGLIPPYFEPLSLLLGGLAAVVSALLLAVGTWPLYAFGQIVSDLHAIRKDGVQASGTAGETAETGPADPKASAAQENPDELPEL